MSYREQTIQSFINELGSKAPVPGGGGASALCGAVAAALGGMVCCLTSGKKKYIEFEPDIQRLLAQSKILNDRLLTLVDRDGEVFAPLAVAYSMPTATEKECELKEKTMQSALVDATLIPLEIMRAACDTIELHAELAGKCSKLAISDVGVGAALCRSALTGASLNVYINTKLIKDKEQKDAFNAQAEEMLNKYIPIADSVFSRVKEALM